MHLLTYPPDVNVYRSQVAGGARGRDPGSLRVVSASPRLESVLKETTIDNLMLLADRRGLIVALRALFFETICDELPPTLNRGPPAGLESPDGEFDSFVATSLQ